MTHSEDPIVSAARRYVAECDALAAWRKAVHERPGAMHFRELMDEIHAQLGPRPDPQIPCVEDVCALLVRYWPVVEAARAHVTDASVSADISFRRLESAIRAADQEERR